MPQGLLHVYMGDGKGKTTAAIGLAVRAAGNGVQVVFAQFMKGGTTGEIAALQTFKNVRICRNKKDLGFYKNLSEEEKKEMRAMHNETLQRILEYKQQGLCQLLILDELTYAYAYDLLERKIVDSLLGERNETEIIITGRNPDSSFLEQADYITEMKKVRHPFDKGVKARKGVEL